MNPLCDFLPAIKKERRRERAGEKSNLLSLPLREFGYGPSFSEAFERFHATNFTFRLRFFSPEKSLQVLRVLHRSLVDCQSRSELVNT